MFNVIERIRVPLQTLLDTIYPTICSECDTRIGPGEREGAGFFCAECWSRMDLLSEPHCPICSVPFVSDIALRYSPTHLCGECRHKPPLFSSAITPFVYKGTMATAIKKLKYEKRVNLIGPLSALFLSSLALALRLKSVQVDRILAIPLHPRRLRHREFNPSLLLAHRLAKGLAVPLEIDTLQRIRDTPPQVGLSKEEREQNVKGAFRVATPDRITGQRLLLVDDVYTTGTTLREGAKVLRRAGATDVVVATLARAVH